jgi:predicted TIM-barrel fold metal-dependent hydrolase
MKDQKDAGIAVSITQPVDWGMMVFKGTEYWEDAPVSIEDINKGHADLARKHPGKVYYYCGVDPRRPNAVKLFEKAVTEWGAKGLKLYPPCGFYPQDAKCYRLYQKALDLGVPVLLHLASSSWMRARMARPMWIEDVAIDFPDLNIIIAHSGMQTRSDNALWEEAMGVAWTRPNVYLDISSWNEFPVGLTLNIPELIRKLRIQCDIVGAHHVLFGTDFPGWWMPYDRDETIKYVHILKNLVEIGKEHGAVFSQEEVELIAYGNAERIIGI